MSNQETAERMDEQTLDFFLTNRGGGRRADISQLLLGLPVCRIHGQGQGLVVCWGKGDDSLFARWRNRLTYWCRKHNREYRVMYHAPDDCVLLRCTHETWRNGPDSRDASAWMPTHLQTRGE